MRSALIRPRSDAVRPASRAQARTAARSTRALLAGPAPRRPPRLTRLPAVMNGASLAEPGPVRLREVDLVAHPVQAEGHGLGARRAVEIVGDHQSDFPRHGTDSPK